VIVPESEGAADISDAGGRRGGPIELGVEPHRQSTETPDAGFTRDEVAVVRMLHFMLSRPYGFTLTFRTKAFALTSA